MSSSVPEQIQMPLPLTEIAAFCRRYEVRWLAVFGSALRPNFRPDSDLDILVEFAEGVRPGLFALGAMQVELSEMLGREVDLKTAGFLSPRFRQQVVEQAETIYEA